MTIVNYSRKAKELMKKVQSAAMTTLCIASVTQQQQRSWPYLFYSQLIAGISTHSSGNHTNNSATTMQHYSRIYVISLNNRHVIHGLAHMPLPLFAEMQKNCVLAGHPANCRRRGANMSIYSSKRKTRKHLRSQPGKKRRKTAKSASGRVCRPSRVVCMHVHCMQLAS